MGFESVGVTKIDQEPGGAVPPTVPATPGALVEVRAPLDQVGDAETTEDMLDALAVDEVDDGARSLDEGEEVQRVARRKPLPLGRGWSRNWGPMEPGGVRIRQFHGCCQGT